MPVFEIPKTERWGGAERLSPTFHFGSQEFQFEGEGGFYRPVHISGHVWDVGARGRAKLICLADIRPGDDLEIQNPSFSIAGHLIAVALTGMDQPWNLTPVSNYTNGLQKVIENKVRKFGPCHLSVDVTEYYDDDPRIPRTFHYVARSLTGTVLLDETVVQPWGVVAPVGSSLVLKAYLDEAQQRMVSQNWRIETVRNSPVGNVDFGFLAGHLPPPEHRPYAAVDYVLLTQAQHPLCTPVKSRNYVERIGNGFAFTSTAKALALQCNPLIHNDFVVSDAYGKAHTALLATHGAVVETEQALMNGGGHNAPQVDHIVPQARLGANCLSNAQITSMRYNTSKQQTVQLLDMRDDAWKQQKAEEMKTDPRIKYFPPATSFYHK